jgi:hypothetical protein
MIKKIEAIRQFETAINTEEFVVYEKDFSEGVRNALGQEYSRGEVKSVDALESYINNVPNRPLRSTTAYGLPFVISTHSVFIHGNKSQVEFCKYGKKAGPIELGDLIFIVSLIFNKKKCFEKMTINQFKIDNKRKNSISWTVNNREQLFLLSKFPKFKSVKGMIPKGRDYTLPNISGCLGSYGLIYNPGDFTFISATQLDSFIGNQLSIGKDTLCKHFAMFNNFSLHRSVLLNCHFTPDVNTFVDHYLKMNIGEPVFAQEGIFNLPAKYFLTELFQVLRTKSNVEQNKSLANLVNSFRQFPYADEPTYDHYEQTNETYSRDDGLGLIYTSIKLGELE